LNEDLAQLAATVLVAIIAAGGGYCTARVQARVELTRLRQEAPVDTASAYSTLVKSLQDEVGRLRCEVNALHVLVAELKAANLARDLQNTRLQHELQAERQYAMKQARDAAEQVKVLQQELAETRRTVARALKGESTI